jgi:hypothetical protein
MIKLYSVRAPRALDSIQRAAYLPAQLALNNSECQIPFS